ncbi:MAG: glycosyltransferase family 4 protein [Thermotogae bacterium]|nr:glycosyltransferase family 4 protein [Thermotogota bacterium]
MRILIFSESFLPLRTGVAKFTYELALNLHKRGHDVVVLTANFPDIPSTPFPVETVGEAGRIYANGSFTWFIKAPPWAVFRKFKEVIGRYGVEVFHNQGPLGPPYSMLSAHFVERIDPKIRRVGTFHSKRMRPTTTFKLLGRLLSPLVRRHHVLTAPSKSTAEEMESLLHLRGVRVVPNAVDTDVFRPDNPPLPDLQDGRKTALFVGRLDERKGIDTLMEAWRRLNGAGDFRRAHKLVVVGDGPLKGHVLDVAEETGNVLLYDNVPMGDPNFPRFYTSADFAVFPAKGGEAFGIVILEAFASGRPVIISDIPGYNEVATPETALLVPPDSPEGLARAMARMFSDDEMRRRMGERALTRAREFSWDSVIGRFLDLYQSIPK